MGVTQQSPTDELQLRSQLWTQTIKKKTLKEEDMEKLSESPRLPSPT